MKESKTLSLRLPPGEYIAFDAVCRERGYSKTGKIREFIRNLIKQELESVKVSAQEWIEIEKGIEEIKKGEYVTFEELKRDLKTHRVADNKNIK
jgi:predicted transcriptional regulator